MSLTDDAARVLAAGRVDAVHVSPGRPRPITLDRANQLGAVLFLVDKTDDASPALYGIYSRARADEWEEEAFFGAPWPAVSDNDVDEFDVVAQASMSRDDGCSAVVLVGRVAPGTEVLELMTHRRRTLSVSPEGACIALLVGHDLAVPVRLEAGGRTLFELDRT